MGFKEYEKLYFNDAEMQLATKGGERFETNFPIYREVECITNGEDSMKLGDSYTLYPA